MGSQHTSLTSRHLLKDNLESQGSVLSASSQAGSEDRRRDLRQGAPEPDVRVCRHMQGRTKPAVTCTGVHIFQPALEASQTKGCPSGEQFPTLRIRVKQNTPITSYKTPPASEPTCLRGKGMDFNAFNTVGKSPTLKKNQVNIFIFI